MNFWCGEQLVVTVEGPTGRSVVSLEQPFARVGRHPQSDVVLDDPDASSRSLYLHATPRGVYCLFLDVHESDVLSADVAARGIWLRPDQEITVGSHRVRASLLTAEPDDPLPDDNPAKWGSAPRPLPVLNVYYGDLLKDKRRFRAVLSPIGRRPQCGLQLKAKRVSSFHCVLFWHEQQLWCVDLNSSNGTQLNGESIVCSQVAIGDKLDVGEFSLIFERLSYGRQSPPVVAPPAAAPPAAASSLASVSIAEPQPAGPLSTEPSSELPAAKLSAADSESLRQQLADEIARLAAERATVEERWEQASCQLQSEVAHLHDEAARLAAERTAFDQSRSHWSDERDALNRQLAERSEHLARLQDELTQATESLKQKLAAAQQPIAAIPEDDSPASPDAAMLAALTPTTLVAGLDDELVPPPEPEVVWNYISTDPAADMPPPIDPAEELRSRLEAQWQAEWQEKNRQWTDQVEQLRAQAAELAAERQALAQTRHSWQAEHEALAQSLAARQEQLDRQQAELTQSTTSLAARLAASEAALRSPPAPQPQAVPSSTEPNLEPIAEWDDSPAPEPVEIAPSPAEEQELADSEPVFEAEDEEAEENAAEKEIDLDALEESIATSEELHEPLNFSVAEPAEQASPVAGKLADRDELTLFVSNRLVHRESERRRPRLVWWIVAGTGAIAIAAVVAFMIWRMF
jgi:pSer/pThr/pTyr-binding forkhead associated (FHA) protein